ncbi:hypothetical protein B0J14DRAFT_580142 [Halenospora varia]|nr:hypothetical protein B0J14DRAFT_580142 [Halenospora varia]
MPSSIECSVTPSRNSSSHGPFHQGEASSEIPLSNNLNDLSIATRPCPQCRGLRYGFTAYFHNTKIFSKPPHALLPYIEQSYLLKNRLHTLLVNWVMHPPIQMAQHTKKADIEIRNWGCQVETLLRSVLGFGKSNGANFDRSASKEAVEVLLSWCGEMVTGLQDIVHERKHAEMSERNLKDMLSQFRKLWESVWIFFMAKEEA